MSSIGFLMSSTLSSSSTSTSSSSGFVTLADLKTFTITSKVVEVDVVSVKVGQSVEVSFSVTGDMVDGMVIVIDFFDMVSNNVVQYGVTVILTDLLFDLCIGQTALVSITTGSKVNVLAVFSNAITIIGLVSIVTVCENGKNCIVIVQIGLKGDSYIEVTSGLKVGDVVVLSSSTSGGSGGFTFSGGGLLGGVGGLGR